MSDTQKLVYAVIQFLKSELENGGLSGEAAEGVEVGIQCLEAAYDIGNSNPSLEISCGIQQIFQRYLAENEASPQNKALAETMKTEGNTHMSAQNFCEAIACYTKAIKLDPKNAVYYCNRAAASNKLGNYESAIQDCNTALKIDSSYCKAYGRLGLAYSNLKQYGEAIKYYKMALELEPDNESYKTNLKLAEDSLASSTSTASGSAVTPDLSMIFTNPNLMNMATQMLTNPSMQQMVNNILQGSLAQDSVGRMDVLLNVSQQLAQQMESENPDFVEQLRRQMDNGDGGDAGGSRGGGSADPKPPNPHPES